MTRRRLLLFGLPIALVVLGVCGWLLWPRTAITREHAAKIREGMTLAEVEAILGGPATGEPTRPTEAFHEFYGWKSPQHSTENQWFWWCTDEVHVGVTVNAEGQITRCRGWDVRRLQEGPLEMLRRWLRL